MLADLRKKLNELAEHNAENELEPYSGDFRKEIRELDAHIADDELTAKFANKKEILENVFSLSLARENQADSSLSRVLSLAASSQRCTSISGA